VKLLIIEDDIELAESIKDGLSEYNVVTVVGSGEDGLYSVKAESFDVVVIDITLPDINGIEICKEIRTEGINTPILMLTGKSEISYKLASFSSGADDYLTKPFDLKELEARLNCLYKRAANEIKASTLRLGDLEIDTANKTAKKCGQSIALKRKEFQVLEYLIRNKDRALTREIITENLWNEEEQCESNVVEVYIRNLRKKLDEPFNSNYIKTVYGVGYKISEV
jgi:DNA-binding response OmpR family regulator